MLPELTDSPSPPHLDVELVNDRVPHGAIQLTADRILIIYPDHGMPVS